MARQAPILSLREAARSVLAAASDPALTRAFPPFTYEYYAALIFDSNSERGSPEASVLHPSMGAYQNSALA